MKLIKILFGAMCALTPMANQDTHARLSEIDQQIVEIEANLQAL